MATQKPISTISYNTEAFLKEKLDTWLKAHIIQAYMYIKHKGEDGDKDHIHVYVEPNKKLDVMDLTEQLKEYPIGSTKPLGVRPWRSSKEEDWILYAVHDDDYLKQKYSGGDKHEKLPYKWQDIQCSEDYDVETCFIRAKSKLEHTSTNLAKRLQQGEKATKLIQEGENPYMVNALMQAFSKNDYQRATSDLAMYRAKYEALLTAVYEAGLAIEDDEDGNVKIVKYVNPFENV